MVHRPALVIPVRNKAKHVKHCIETALAQTYNGLRIVISDQGSTDGSKDAIQEAIEGYDGKHEIVLLDCPDRTKSGMAGLNAHIDWVVRTLDDTETFMILGADDDNAPTRVERVMEGFLSTGASYVGTHCYFVDPKGKEDRAKSIWPEKTGVVDAGVFFTQRIGGSCSMNFKRSLYQEFPLKGDMINDLWLPYFATCRDGMFVIAEPLASYYKHADEGNTGVEGQLRAVTDPIKRQELEVKIWCDITRTMEKIHTRAQQMLAEAWPPASRHGLYMGIIEHGIGWARATSHLEHLKAQVEPEKAAA